MVNTTRFLYTNSQLPKISGFSICLLWAAGLWMPNHMIADGAQVFWLRLEVAFVTTVVALAIVVSAWSAASSAAVLYPASTIGIVGVGARRGWGTRIVSTAERLMASLVVWTIVVVSIVAAILSVSACGVASTSAVAIFLLRCGRCCCIFFLLRFRRGILCRFGGDCRAG